VTPSGKDKEGIETEAKENEQGSENADEYDPRATAIGCCPPDEPWVGVTAEVGFCNKECRK